MTDMVRVRVGWSGAQIVGPGVSTFYAAGATGTGMPAALVALFTAIKVYVPSGITWDVSGIGDVITVETGELTGTVAIGGGGTVLSSAGVADYKPGVGMRILWATGGVVGGRRVHGTTFICPLLGSEYPNGQVSPLTRTAISTAANAYVSAAGFDPVIWSKPKEVTPPAIGPARPGAISTVVSGVAMSPMTWLRSRRT
jgi:hypothetical protein